MIIRNLCLLGFAALAVAACDDAAEPDSAPAQTPAAQVAPVTPAPATAGTVTLDGEGLRLSTNAPALVPFGAPTADVVALVKAALGTDPVTQANPDCPNGATVDLAWGENLSVITRDGQFVGWTAKAAGPKTRSGVEVGSSRQVAEAGAAFQTSDSTFDLPAIEVDGVSGFLTADGAKVENLFGGDTCLAS